MPEDKFAHITLSSIYKRKKNDRDIFEELMPSKIKEVLLVATLYDAYSIIREGQFNDKIIGEYLQLNLYTAPRYTSATNQEEALNIIHKKHIDMVVIMVGVDRVTPWKIADAIRNVKSRTPILLLVNNNNDIRFFKHEAMKTDAIDRVFVWNGNSNVFLAMNKYIEDKKNAERDTRVGNTQIILLVEDSVKYYSRYLPLLYSSIMTQTQALVADNTTDELHVLLKMRARPKILLTSTFEEATEIIHKYGDYLLCVISDVKFLRNGVADENAGIDLINYTKENLSLPIPIMLQSQDPQNREKAKQIGADFIDKNSESLAMDIEKFIYKKLGFGSFIFRNADGNKIAEARNLNEFEDLLKTVPIDSLIYHGNQNSFSTWLMARGEINMARRLRPYKVEDFDNPEEIRQFCVNVFDETQDKRNKGRIIKFDTHLVRGNQFITRLGRGSLGGKGRGLAFINNLIENIDFKAIIPNINIQIPSTAIIGTIEFDKFIDENNLYHKVYVLKQYNHVKELFLQAELSKSLSEKLFKYVKKIKKPLAIRSSGLFEDSLLQPFAGVYSTYLLPNNHPDTTVRHEQLCTAIKLVYASIFTENAQAYFDAINYKIEEEKMAVIVQEMVGHDYNKKFYPNISGVAQSYNYYPVAYMEPEDGFAVMAVGFGSYVVGGEKAHRFCPKYPKLNVITLADQIKDSQKYFYALDLSHYEYDFSKNGEEAAIKRFSFKDEETSEMLFQCASVYDYKNDTLVQDLSIKGPRIIDFANILKYNTAPVADSQQLLLKLFKESMGSPVEIEFAVDLEKGENNLPTFYVLQIKPLVRREEHVDIDLSEIDQEKAIMIAHKGMGNGKICGIHDLIFIKPETFNRTVTREIAHEVNEINQKLEHEKKEYILIGPGRWGTRDPFTGIPVQWAQISKARVIVEMGLENFPLDASLGSHFFHNVTSMNVGYFSIPFHSTNDVLRLETIRKQEVIEDKKFIQHVRFQSELTILMDGKKRTAFIST